MKLEADARIAFPREVVFSAYRDRLAELVPYLPNVRSIEVQERTDSVGGVEGRTNMVNIWSANADIPKLLQGVVPPDAVKWTDRAEWDQSLWTCKWQIEPAVFTRNVRCGGLNTYREENGQTLLEIRGHLEVDPTGIPGVPRLLAGKVAPMVESFIVNLIKPNLVSVADGLGQFLKANS